MRTNKPTTHVAKTHEGGRADPHQKPEQELLRAVSTCLLFENTFYETGNDIADRIATLCTQVDPYFIAGLAVKARNDLKLRHVPLFLCVQLLKRKPGKIAGDTIEAVVQRPDEMGELLALYRKEKRFPLAHQLKRGLAAAYHKFSPYQLAKWNGDAAFKLRDVLFLVHSKPITVEGAGTRLPGLQRGKYSRGPVARHDNGQAAIWKQLIDGTLESPDTWEVALSAGKDKKETWTRLLTEKKLGYMALLMNLRNMGEAGVEPALVEEALRAGAPKSKALPFRFVSAYKHAPQYGQALSDAMELAVTGELEDSTVLVLDVSGSMDAVLSAKSTLHRYEAAAALAVLVRGIAKSCRIFCYANNLGEVANFKGLAVLNAVKEGMQKLGGGTETAKALREVQKLCPNADRVILLTDEQAHDGIHPAWAPHSYIVNVAPYAPGLETGGKWVRINGWSERLIDWMQLHEKGEA